MVGELLGQIAVYFVRILILRAHADDLKSGLADAGYYHAALTVTGILPGFVFGAMGTDFFPGSPLPRPRKKPVRFRRSRLRPDCCWRFQGWLAS